MRLRSSTLALALAALGCASTVAPRDRDAAPDLPVAPDLPITPDTAFDGDATPSFDCAYRLIVASFTLRSGGYGAGRLVFDPRRRVALLVSFDTGTVTRIAPETGALSRLTPIRYPNGVERAEVFVDEAADTLVVVPLRAPPTQVLTLALANPDHWETLGVVTSSAPTIPSITAAAYDVAGRALRVTGSEVTYAARREVWDLRHNGGWGWVRRPDFTTPAPVALGAATWDATRNSMLVVTWTAETTPWVLWSVGDVSTALTETVPRGVEAPLLAYDAVRRVTWSLTSMGPGATLTALSADATGRTRSVALADPSRALRATPGPLWVAFDRAGRMLYTYADNIAAGLPSIVTAIPVDRCLPR